MRALAIVLLVVALSAFGAYVWLMSNLFPKPSPSSSLPETTYAPTTWTEPQVLEAKVVTANGFGVVSRGQQVTSGIVNDTGTCTDPLNALVAVQHTGRARVTLEVRPHPNQQLVIKAVEVHVARTYAPTRNPAYLYHCAGTAAAPATRVQVESREGARFPVEGPWPLPVPADGYRQDIEIELNGTDAVDLSVRLDYTLDGNSDYTISRPAAWSLIIEPRPADVTGHWTWCDRKWRVGERC
ncbi:hypothetical protein LFM09_28365 [Lentzea alba]|uniref:hypothetical protein n=1 Tax=Lentzea alba TaxID=2714351 RepID=UPI0039BF77F3